MDRDDAARCKERVRKRLSVPRGVDTQGVRYAIALILVACTALVSATAPAASSGSPLLRIGLGPALTVLGSGFIPGALVRIRVVGGTVDKRVSVRANGKGTFFVRFAGLERCSADQVTATSAGARAHVPTPWFVRECPPPPPLAPGVYALD